VPAKDAELPDRMTQRREKGTYISIAIRTNDTFFTFDRSTQQYIFAVRETEFHAIELRVCLVPYRMQNTKYQILWNDEIQNAKFFMGAFCFIQNAKIFRVQNTGPCLLPPKNLKIFEIPCHIESLDAYMKY